MFDLPEFIHTLTESLTKTKYNFLFGCDLLKPTKWLRAECIIPQPVSHRYDYEMLSELFTSMMLSEALKHLKTNPYVNNVGVPFVKHEKVWYFTSDVEFYKEDMNGIHHIPTLDGSVTYTNEKSISDLENWLGSVTFKNNVLRIDFPLYLS